MCEKKKQECRNTAKRQTWPQLAVRQSFQKTECEFRDCWVKELVLWARKQLLIFLRFHMLRKKPKIVFKKNRLASQIYLAPSLIFPSQLKQLIIPNSLVNKWLKNNWNYFFEYYHFFNEKHEWQPLCHSSHYHFYSEIFVLSQPSNRHSNFSMTNLQPGYTRQVKEEQEKQTDEVASSRWVNCWQSLEEILVLSCHLPHHPLGTVTFCIKAKTALTELPWENTAQYFDLPQWKINK